MWRCSHCGAEVEESFDVCWSCSTARSGASYEEFHAAATETPPPAPVAMQESERISVLQAIEDGLRAVAGHPVLLLVVVLGTVVRLVESDLAPAVFVRGGGTPLPWDMIAWSVERLVVSTLTRGFVIAFLYGAASGRTPVGETVSAVVARLPSLVATQILVVALFGGSLWLGSRWHSALWSWVVMVPQLYVTVRVVFWSEVVVVEGAGPGRALRRSWELVAGNWWGLAFLTRGGQLGAAMLRSSLPTYLMLPASSLLEVVGAAVMACAYLQRVGLLPRRLATLTEVVSARREERSGILERI
jgi:hypothetical protein